MGFHLSPHSSNSIIKWLRYKGGDTPCSVLEKSIIDHIDRSTSIFEKRKKSVFTIFISFHLSHHSSKSTKKWLRYEGGTGGQTDRQTDIVTDGHAFHTGGQRSIGHYRFVFETTLPLVSTTSSLRSSGL